MFTLEKPKNNFENKIKNFLNKLLKKTDYILFKITNQKIILLSFKIENNQKIILAAEIFFIENLIENISKKDVKDSFCFLIKKFIKKNNIKLKNLIGIINEENYFYQILGATNKNQVINNIKNKINESYEIYEISEINPLNKITDHQDFALWVTNKNYLNSINNIFKTINLNILDFEPENKNIIYAIFDNFQTKDAYLIINILENKIYFIIFAGTAIHFSGFINYGLNNLNENLNDFIEQINELIYFYTTKSQHEHGASSKINQIIIIGNIDNESLSLISFNTKIKAEKIKIYDVLSDLKFKNEIIKDFIIKNQSDFIALIGKIKSCNLIS